MSSSVDFTDFLTKFFGLFVGKSFRGGDYLAYLKRPTRSGDEASIVDTAIIGPLLGLLGFEPAERVYNQQHQNGRPDFAPTNSLYGTCFVVEDKSTSLDLNFDLNDPESHLSQMAGYVRFAAASLGWLTNGRQLTVWSFENPNNPTCIIDLDIAAAIQDWHSHTPPALSPSIEKALHDLFDLCHKESFSDPQRLEREIGKDLEEWQWRALPLGTGEGYETVLVKELHSLVMELQRDARRIFDHHLTRAAEYFDRVYRLADDVPELATQKLKELRNKVLSILINSCQVIWGLEDADIEAIETILVRLEQDVNAFFSSKEVLAAILDVINAARKRKYANRPKAAQPMSDLDDVPPLREALQNYSEKTFDWHKRQATLHYDYRTDRSVFDDYYIWASSMRETMLDGSNEEQRRELFALQAACVVFIRLLLIRFCEDKGVLPYRFLSGDGLRRWQRDIERYFIFAQGNPYDPLLDMAYANVQQIYAHLFTGHELFNWYRLDREHFVMAIHRFSRFNFASIESLTNIVTTALTGSKGYQTNE